MIIEMIMTTVRVKMRAGVGFISPKATGWELDFLILTIALTLALVGAGALSLDAALKSKRGRG